jgi:hypothetical protein
LIDAEVARVKLQEQLIEKNVPMPIRPHSRVDPENQQDEVPMMNTDQMKVIITEKDEDKFSGTWGLCNRFHGKILELRSGYTNVGHHCP